MQIIVQSQAHAEPGYIHLAYISAAATNHISRGDLFPLQAYLGAALATAVACGVVARKFSRVDRRTSVKAAGLLGFVGALCALWLIESAWRTQRPNDEVVRHVIKTRQWWALRDPAIAAGVESATRTNAAAAHLAANYYHLAPAQENEPEGMVKRYWFSEKDTNEMGRSHWPTLDAAHEPPLQILTNFQTALKRGKLSNQEQAWVQEKLADLRRSLPPGSKTDGTN